ncbi:MAG: hypothetical protein INQ03_13955 [Candidatus Heimdallarchaeota archaeon]|nr:hypothetical protein [Candidatus Heimdallarchaeota archaeon]
MDSRFRYFSIIAVILLLISSSLIFLKRDIYTEGVWVYSDTPELEELDFVLLSVSGKKINAESSQYNISYHTEIEKRIEYFQKKRIEVRLMTLEDPVFSFLNKSDSIKEHLDGIHNLMAKYNLNEIHLDIEPHALEAWKVSSEEDKQDILDEFIEVIDLVDDYTLYPISLAITWWLPKNYDLSELKADYLYLMIYGGTGGSLEDIQGRIYADRPYYVGLGLSEYSSIHEMRAMGETLSSVLEDDLYLGNCYFIT